jgi:hypothetical protein
MGCLVRKRQREAKDWWQAANAFPAMTALSALFPERGAQTKNTAIAHPTLNA